MEGINKQRLFVALCLPEPVRRLVASLAEPLHGVSWVRSDQLHATVRFLGDVEAERIAGMCERLGALQIEPFLLPVETVGVVGDISSYPANFGLASATRDARYIQAGLKFSF